MYIHNIAMWFASSGSVRVGNYSNLSVKSICNQVHINLAPFCGCPRKLGPALLLLPRGAVLLGVGEGMGGWHWSNSYYIAYGPPLLMMVSRAGHTGPRGLRCPGSQLHHHYTSRSGPPRGADSPDFYPRSLSSGGWLDKCTRSCLRQTLHAALRESERERERRGRENRPWERAINYHRGLRFCEITFGLPLN